MYPCIYWMIHGGLAEIKIENQSIFEIRDALINSLKKRFKYEFDNNLFIAATFLNYKFKKFEFISDVDKRKDLINDVKQYIAAVHAKKFEKAITNTVSNSTVLTQTATQNLVDTPLLTDVTNSQLINHNSKRKNNKGNSMSSRLIDKIASGERSCLEIELENYEKSTFTSKEDPSDNDAPIIFFRLNKISYPNLSDVARIIFSVPVTSVPSESLFSQAGETQDDLRNRLKASNLESLTFCKYNRLAMA